jgi:hypothetical protein
MYMNRTYIRTLPRTYIRKRAEYENFRWCPCFFKYVNLQCETLPIPESLLESGDWLGS